jgi:dTDP-4-amino-4,6-dideoxygalactose transaminase
LAENPILFSVPFLAPQERENLDEVLSYGHVHGDGPFTQLATSQLKSLTGASEVLLTTSGTSALEMAVRLLDIGPGDEVILPSFTFSSGASSIVATGAIPIFVDIDIHTGCIDVNKIEAAITGRTKAISVMHYGGQPVDMDSVLRLAARYNLRVIEDNAHGLGVSTPQGVLGTRGDLGIQSFHDTKNVHCGEGGALLINDTSLFEPAEIMREKGTNRSNFLRGEVDKYTWVNWGSSFLPSELNAAVLHAQLSVYDEIQHKRTHVWNSYSSQLQSWAEDVGVTLMAPPGGIHASHLFFIRMPDHTSRNNMLSHLRSQGIVGTFHYVPLHSSPAGEKFGRVSGDLSQTNIFSETLIRLPLWPSMTDADISRVVGAVTSGFRP